MKDYMKIKRDEGSGKTKSYYVSKDSDEVLILTPDEAKALQVYHKQPKFTKKIRDR